MSAPIRFRALASSRLNIERDAEGRVWTQLFPLGTWHRADFPGGKVELTPEFLGQFITSWKAGGSPPLPLDYDHKEDGPASGWIEDLRQRPSGELEGAVKWTDEAAAEIRADKRRYISPTWSMQHTNRRTGEKGGPWLYGAALLNDPFYDSMPRVAASDNPQHRSKTMFTDEQLKMLRANLFLAADASPEDILTATKPLTASASETVEKLTASMKAQTDAEAKLTAANAEIATLKANAEKAGKERFDEQVETAIKAAKLEGRAVDAMVATKAFKAATDIETVKELLVSVAPTVPLQAKGNPAKPESAPADAKAQYDALVAAEQAKGLKFTEASRLVAKNNPELSAKVFGRPAPVPNPAS